MSELPLEAYLTALASLDGVGPAGMRWLLSHGAPSQVWEWVRSTALPPVPSRLAMESSHSRSWADAARRIDPAECWRRCLELGVGVVSLGSPGYPPALALDRDPPVVLFHLGRPDVLDAPRVAIIGTRRATGYGLAVAERFGRELTRAGVVVVSGLALGIDAAAHRGSVSVAEPAAGVAAVVGSGLDSPCPARNRMLARSVVERGVLFSEVPPGVAARPWRFPVRNRVLAALADAVVVIESPGAGGSMHTVREAMGRDRPVLAVPGPIDSRASEGTNRLISEGAHPCLQVDDVLMAIGMDAVTPARPNSADTSPADPRPDPGGDGASVLEAVGWRPVTIEHLALRTGLEFGALAVALGELESAGWIQRTGGWIERRAKPEGVRRSGSPTV